MIGTNCKVEEKVECRGSMIILVSFRVGGGTKSGGTSMGLCCERVGF